MPIKEISQTHSSFDARSYEPVINEMLLKMNKGEINFAEDSASLSKIGIGWNRGVLARQAKLAYDSYVMDSIQQPLTTPSIATPVQFLQNWLPGFVKIITAVREIDNFIGINTTGSWEDEEIVQPVLENTGTAVPYGDTTNVPLSNYNPNYVTRTVIRFESGMRVGNLEEARAAKVRINSGQEKRDSCALALEIQRNAVGFYGYNSGNNFTYGFLNDPNLPAYVQVATGVGGYHWSQKTFQEIKNDILTGLVSLRTQSQGVINPNKNPITLAVATNAVDYLATVTDFGISVMDWLKSTYPNIRVENAPQLNNANASEGVFYLYAESVQDTSTDDGRTFAQVVPAKFQILGVQKLVKGYEEDYSNASAGVMVKRPYAIYRAYNIS